MRPLGSIRALAKERAQFQDLFGVLVRLVARRKSVKTKLFIELLRIGLESVVKATLSPAMEEAEYWLLMQEADPALFSRGDIYFVRDSGAFLVPAEQLERLDSKSFELNGRDVSSLPEGVVASRGALVFMGGSSSDVQNWGNFCAVEFRRTSVFGSRSRPRIELILTHTGEPETVASKWELEDYKESLLGGAEDLVHSYEGVFEFPGAVACRAFCFLAYGGARRVRFASGEWIFREYSERVSIALAKALGKQLPIRVKNDMGFYFDMDISNLKCTGPLGELPERFVKAVESGCAEYAFNMSHAFGFRDFVGRAERMTVEKESKILESRKRRALGSARVCFRQDDGKKEYDLYRVPANEQDVVLLTSMLAQYGIVPAFSFLDYDTHQGIDAIARVQLSKGSAVDQDAVVEFKFMLEGILDNRHPLSLVDLIVAWDCKPEKIEGAGYKLTGPVNGKKWLRRIEDPDGNVAEVMLLRYHDRLSIKLVDRGFL